MPNIDPHEALAVRLDELTETVTNEGDPKEQAATALLIAQARKELAQALEVRKRIDQPWWMGRKLEVLIGVVIAAAVIAGYFFTNLRPLLSADVRLALKNAEIAQKQAKIQEQDTQLTRQENDRVRKMIAEREADLTKAREELTVANEGFQVQLTELAEDGEARLAELQDKLAEAQQRGAETDQDQLRDQLGAIQAALSKTQQARSEASSRTERLRGVPEMVEIPGGEFQMGSTNLSARERPVHNVKVSPFLLSKYEVTFDEYDLFAEGSGRRKPNDQGWGRGRRPVINVSWEDATAYAQWLSEQTGNEYRLPTEAEWEYAVRARTTTLFSFGDDGDKLSDYAWFDSNSDSKTHRVGAKKPNHWGLYDMHGNVWEWVQDWYGDYSSNAEVDPKGPDNGKYRVIRGGSWRGVAPLCRSALRSFIEPDFRFYDLGFRLARSVALGP